MSTAAISPSVASSSSATRSRPTVGARLLVTLAILLLAYAPMLWTFFHQQWQKPHYQYFPFVIAAFVWLLWQRYGEGVPLKLASERSHAIESALCLFAGLLLLSAILVHSPWCAMISFIILMAAMCYAFSRSRHIVNLWGIWVLLWLIVPLPFNFDQRLTKVLQLASSQVSSYVLDWCGIYHLMEGNTLWLRSKPLFVDEACSGIISMLSIIACAVVFAVVMNRTPLHMLLLAIAGVGWAAIMNVARISTIAIGLEHWGVDWSAGTPHELLSLVLFLVAFLALMSTDQILLVCLEPLIRRGTGAPGHEMQTGLRLAKAWDAAVEFGNPLKRAAPSEPQTATAFSSVQDELRVPWFAWVTFVPAALIQLLMLGYMFNVSGEYRPAVERAVALTANDMPASLCGLRKVDFNTYDRSENNAEGTFSRTYQYQSADGATYLVSCDFPFIEFWHELTACYRGNGWELLSRRSSSEIDPQRDEKAGYIEASFSKPGGEAALLFFSEFDQAGAYQQQDRDWNTNPLSFWETRYLYLTPQRLFQVQVWVTASSGVSDAQEKTARELFLASRELLRARIVAATSEAPQPASQSETPASLPSGPSK